jgi:hypothetical protein
MRYHQPELMPSQVLRHTMPHPALHQQGPMLFQVLRYPTKREKHQAKKDVTDDWEA